VGHYPEKFLAIKAVVSSRQWRESDRSTARDETHSGFRCEPTLSQVRTSKTAARYGQASHDLFGNDVTSSNTCQLTW
jgi:hypothetical protein